MKHALIVLALVRAAGTAHAHGVAPALLQLDETAPGVGSARFRAPTGAQLEPRWPVGCDARPGPTTVVAEFTEQQFRFDCRGRTLPGRTLGVDGLAGADGIVVVRVHLADGRVERALLGPTRPGLRIPAATSPRSRWGNLAIALALLVVAVLAARSPRAPARLPWRLSARVRTGLAYAIGTVAAMTCLERVLTLLA